MFGLAKTAGVFSKAKNFVHDVTGKNEERAHQHLLNMMKLEKEKKVKPVEISKAIKNNSIASENKYKARRRGAAALAGATALGLGGAGVADVHHQHTKHKKEGGL